MESTEYGLMNPDGTVVRVTEFIDVADGSSQVVLTNQDNWPMWLTDRDTAQRVLNGVVGKWSDCDYDYPRVGNDVHLSACRLCEVFTRIEVRAL